MLTSTPPMEKCAGGPDGRGNDQLYSQIHGHHSERSSGAKTPRTPSLREATPNYNDMYLSSRSSRERTPSMRNGSGEKTPATYDCRLLPSGKSSKTARENEQPDVNQCTRSEDKTYGEKFLHKRERPSEGKRMYYSEEEYERDDQRGHSSSIIIASRRLRAQSLNKHRQVRAALGPHRKDGLSKSMEFKNPGKIFDETSTEEDSTCTLFSRGKWKSTNLGGLRSELMSNPQVPVVRRHPHAQAKTMGKFNDEEIMCEDGRDNTFQSSKINKNLTQQKAVAAVLAFQRWRHTQLKKLFSKELKKLLEEAKEDEACLATLEQELAMKDKHLVQLRAQVAQYERASGEQMNQSQMHELLGANLQELEEECNKALKRASLAEEVLKKRDAEVLRLRERLRSVDEEGVRIDTELQARIKQLQNEKESALGEGRVLLAQLGRRDEEVTQHCKEIEKLRATVAQVIDRQTSQLNQIESMKVDHQTQVEDLQEKLQSAYAGKHSKEMELASYTEKCSGLGQERQNLLVQLNRAVERADLASRRAEELQMKLHCTTEERAKASEDIAGEMVEHLKRLTGHMKELETSVDRTALCVPAGAFQKKAGLAKISAKLAEAEVEALNLITTDSNEHVRWPGALQEPEEGRKQVCFSFGAKNKGRLERQYMLSSGNTPFTHEGNECDISAIDRDIALTKFKNWTAWKWRWAASAARADSLAKQLQNQRIVLEHSFEKENEGSIHQLGNGIRERTKDFVNKLESSEFTKLSIAHRTKLGALIMKHKIVPLIMTAWRAFTRISNLERKATCRNESLEKIISALPWWIRRVGERRLVERYFFHWQLIALRAIRDKSQQTEKKKPVSSPSPGYSSRRSQDPTWVQSEPQLRNSTILTQAALQDAEVQTAAVLPQEAQIQAKKTLVRAAPVKAATPRFDTPPWPKSDTKRVIPCPTCDIRRKFSGAAQQQPSRNLQHTLKVVDSEIDGVNETTFTTRALQALQSSLQQELRELQHLLSQEMQNMQQIRPATEEDDHGKEVGCADLNRQALTSVFEVCSNLAKSLTDVRSQLSNVEKKNGFVSHRLPCGTEDKGSCLHTKHEDAKQTWEGSGRGYMTRQKSVPTRPSVTCSVKETPHYASPLGREKSARFKSPGWQQRNECSTREAWNSPHSALFPQHEARGYASLTSREPRFQDTQHPHDDYGKSLRPCPQQRDEMVEQEQKRHPASSAAGRGEREWFTKGEVKSSQRESNGADGAMCNSLSTNLSPPSDYTTVVQILNQENNKIGEVAIYTSGAAVMPSIRGGAADLCSTARESIPTEIQDNLRIHQRQQQGQHHEQQTRPKQVVEESICKPSIRLKSALKSPAKRQSTMPDRSQYQSIVTGSADTNRRMESTHLLPCNKRRPCIGSEYATLLKSEIHRLREGRLVMVDDETNCSQAIAPRARELTPRRGSTPCPVPLGNKGKTALNYQE